MTPPCLTLSIIRYGSRVKWRNPGKGVASSPTSWCSSYRKRCLQVTLDYGLQLYFYLPFSVDVSPVWSKYIYSVLCALTWRRMPAAARSRLYSRVSVWAGAFARSAISSALSASVIDFAGYLLLLSFVRLKLFSLILSMDLIST